MITNIRSNWYKEIGQYGGNSLGTTLVEMVLKHEGNKYCLRAYPYESRYFLERQTSRGWVPEEYIGIDKEDYLVDYDKAPDLLKKYALRLENIFLDKLKNGTIYN